MITKVTEIIEALPQLALEDRRTIRRKLQELADQDDEGVRLCDETALAGALILDQLENEDDEASPG